MRASPLFVAAYRTAAEKLQRGDPNPVFPLGCFPPALPFVGGRRGSAVSV
jgi:hypothetical protein